MLVLLPTDTNKLLVQRKGPYDIVNTVSPNDYKVKINGKERTMNANLLKDDETVPRVTKVSGQVSDDLNITVVYSRG